MTERRWIPEGGLRKHREKIHRESKIADEYKNLPFKFSKPVKPKKINLFACAECNRVFLAPINTIMCVCPDCNKVTKVKKVDNG